MYQLIIRPEAEADIAAAKKWCSARQRELGDQFLAAVESVLDRISKSPEISAQVTAMCVMHFCGDFHMLSTIAS